MSRQRGQTLVLAALVTLLIALMAIVTISIGWRVRDRIEAQMAADAAAYSQAVDVARAYNELALMNRTIIAMEVSALGMSALISWSSHYRSNLVATEAAITAIAAQYAAQCCGIFCPCQCFEAARSAAAAAAALQELTRARNRWRQLEPAAAAQLHAQWHGAGALFELSKDMLRDQVSERRMEDAQLEQTLATFVSRELAAPRDGADVKNVAELSESRAGQGNRSYATFYDRHEVLQAVVVAMGTRGDDFVTARVGGRQPIYDKLQPLVSRFNGSASVDPAAYDGAGGTAIGSNAHHNLWRNVRPGMPWADDHGGALTVSWPSACRTSMTIPVIDTELASGLDRARHRYLPGDGEDARTRHALGEDGAVFPNMFVYATEQVDKPDNDFGQPKMYAILDRDYRRVRAKPWDLRFQLAGSDVDLNGPRSTFKSPSGADLQHQTALSSAIVYYHRPGAWKEPPNFFNPFWRATLYAADKEDLKQYLTVAGFPQHGDTVQRLLDLNWVGTR